MTPKSFVKVRWMRLIRPLPQYSGKWTTTSRPIRTRSIDPRQCVEQFHAGRWKSSARRCLGRSSGKQYGSPRNASLTTSSDECLSHQEFAPMPQRIRDRAQASVHYLPQPRNRNFVGRQRVLESMTKTFGASAGRVQVICGAGGVGKTQLAMEYAYRHANQYRLIWWLPSAEANTLASFYLSLAE